MLRREGQGPTPAAGQNDEPRGPRWLDRFRRDEDDDLDLIDDEDEEDRGIFGRIRDWVTGTLEGMRRKKEMATPPGPPVPAVPALAQPEPAAAHHLSRKDVPLYPVDEAELLALASTAKVQVNGDHIWALLSPTGAMTRLLGRWTQLTERAQAEIEEAAKSAEAKVKALRAEAQKLTEALALTRSRLPKIGDRYVEFARKGGYDVHKPIPEQWDELVRKDAKLPKKLTEAEEKRRRAINWSIVIAMYFGIIAIGYFSGAALGLAVSKVFGLIMGNQLMNARGAQTINQAVYWITFVGCPLIYIALSLVLGKGAKDRRAADDIDDPRRQRRAKRRANGLIQRCWFFWTALAGIEVVGFYKLGRELQALLPKLAGISVDVPIVAYIFVPIGISGLFLFIDEKVSEFTHELLHPDSGEVSEEERRRQFFARNSTLDEARVWMDLWIRTNAESTAQTEQLRQLVKDIETARNEVRMTDTTAIALENLLVEIEALEQRIRNLAAAEPTPEPAAPVPNLDSASLASLGIQPAATGTPAAPPDGSGQPVGPGAVSQKPASQKSPEELLAEIDAENAKL